MLQPEKPSAGANAELDSVSFRAELSEEEVDFGGNAEEVDELHASADAEAANPKAELCCDVEAAAPAADEIKALEENVKAKVEAQQRDNESVNEARQAFPGLLAQGVVEKPLGSLRSMQEMKS